MKKIEIFKVEGDRISRQRRHCPKCGDGVFLAEHKNRVSCGKCGYTEFKGSVKKQQPTIDKKPEPQPEIKEEKPTEPKQEEAPVEEPPKEEEKSEPETPVEETPSEPEKTEETPSDKPFDEKQ